MHNLWILGICFFIGYILRITNKIPDNAPKTINAFILHISLPAQILLFISKIEFSAELLLPTGMAWLVFLSVTTLIFIFGAVLALDSKTIGCLILTAGLGNTSFLGLPMIEAFFGKEFNSIGILCDQPGTFLILSLVAIPIALHKSSESTNFFSLLKRVLTFPPFITFVIAVFASQFVFNSIFVNILSRLGDTLAPLALFSVGFQFRLNAIQKIYKELALGIFLKMILAPVIIFSIYILLFKNSSMIAKISVFEAAMPPMITGGIIAIENDLSPDLASMMVAVGVLVSSISLPLWKIILDLF